MILLRYFVLVFFGWLCGDNMLTAFGGSASTIQMLLILGWPFIIGGWDGLASANYFPMHPDKRIRSLLWGVLAYSIGACLGTLPFAQITTENVVPFLLRGVLLGFMVGGGIFFLSHLFIGDTAMKGHWQEDSSAT